MYKMLLFDLDGTLLRSDKTISERTKAALSMCKEKGYLIGISTSRGLQNTYTFLDSLQPDLLITSGGALVQKNDKYIYKAEFSENETRRIIDLAQSVCGAQCEITVDTIDAHYWNYKIDPKSLDESWGDSVYSDFENFEHAALKICVEIFDETQAEILKKSLPECDCARFSDGYWYKFTKNGITKRRAIEEICRTCEIDASQIISFGDDYADIEMLEISGLGVAMGNAISEVKEIADIVIGSNDEDGIAKYLEALGSMSESIKQ